jgi:hypothetical protein
MTANRTGGGKTLEQDFRDIDAMPRPLKEVYWRAPLNIGTMTLKRMRELGIARARAQAICDCASYAAKQNIKAYGKGHPCQERLVKALAIGVSMDSRATAAPGPSGPQGRPAQSARSGPSGPQGRMAAAPHGACRPQGQ